MTIENTRFLYEEITDENAENDCEYTKLGSSCEISASSDIDESPATSSQDTMLSSDDENNIVPAFKPCGMKSVRGEEGRRSPLRKPHMEPMVPKAVVESSGSVVYCTNGFDNDTSRRSTDSNSLLDNAKDDDGDNENPPPPPPPMFPPKYVKRRPPPLKSASAPMPMRVSNHIQLHIYDLISSDTLMQLPWGCVCEIGKCFNEMNSALHELGTGAYHVGVECNGIEYAYGACNQPNKTGVFSCIPKLSPGYQYRTTIDFGFIPLVRSSWVSVPAIPKSPMDSHAHDSPRSTCSGSSFHYREEFLDGRQVIKEMATEYMGIDYDILKRNCCTFAADACVRLGVPEDQVPTWFRNLAQTGAYSHSTFVEPIQHVLSSVGNQQSNFVMNQNGSSKSLFEDQKLHQYNRQHHDQLHCSSEDQEPGFEVIAQRNSTNTRDVVVVIDADPAYPTRTFRPYRKSATVAH
jgi:PPPDE putative peptidase domain